MKTKNIIFLLAIFMLAACKKNDDRAPIEIALQNEPPLPFNLVDVPDDAIDVDVLPALSWESAKNPKGSDVTYDLYLGINVNPTTPYESNIGATSLDLTNRLQLLTDYHWKVVATDSEGKTARSTINKFTTRSLNLPENAVTNEANFTARSAHTATAFDDKLWVIGGNDGVKKNDIWSSSDGINWNEVIPTTPFPKRAGHTTTVFKDKIWVIGGYDGNEPPSNDVWFSKDKVKWQWATSSAALPQRKNHTTVVFDDKLWVIAGKDDDGLKKNDVWFSSNGIDWELATDAAPFSKRNYHASIVFDDKMWVFGGRDIDILNDAWYSTDGVSWTKANITSPYSKRYGHTCTVFGNKIWMFGGFFFDGEATKAFYSTDGIRWEEVDISDAISARSWHGTTVFDNRLWIIGGHKALGFGLGSKNDVWAMD